MKSLMEKQLNKTADYPDHPDSVIITKKESLSGSEMTEKDIYTYYEGIKKDILKELKDKNLFIRLKTKTSAIYIRHPYSGNSEYIRISNDKQFEEYHTGRIVEFHTTMPAMCPFYVVDFDAVGDWGKTKKITAEIADGLEKLPEVKKVEIRYSGKRGFHVLGWLKSAKPVDKAREDLKAWLKETFEGRKDLVLGESPSGSKGALGVSPMKLNGGQVAKWSLRVTGLCCIEVPRLKLLGFNKTDAKPEKVYKKLTGKSFTPMEKKTAALRVMKAFLSIEGGTYPNIEKAMSPGRRTMLIRPSSPKEHVDPDKHFAKPGEIVWMINNDGDWVQLPYSSKLEEARKNA